MSVELLFAFNVNEDLLTLKGIYRTVWCKELNKFLIDDGDILTGSNLALEKYDGCCFPVD